jgi:hypothetical protein
MPKVTITLNDELFQEVAGYASLRTGFHSSHCPCASQSSQKLHVPFDLETLFTIDYGTQRELLARQERHSA